MNMLSVNKKKKAERFKFKSLSFFTRLKIFRGFKASRMILLM